MYDKMLSHDKKAVRDLIRELLGRGCAISVHDEEEWVCKRSMDYAVVEDALCNTDQDEVVARDAGGVKLGWFLLVYGNGPGETIADCTANEFCESICNKLEG